MTMAATLSRWLIGFGSIGLLAMTAIIGWQVFGRFVLNSSPSWTEQASLIMMIWYVMFAGSTVALPILAYAVSGDRLDPMLERLKDWMERQHATLVAVILVVIGLLVAYKGIHAL